MDGGEGAREENLDSETGEIRQTVICLRSERPVRTGDSREDGAGTRAWKRKKRRFRVPISYVKGDCESRRRRGLDGCGRLLLQKSIAESVIRGTQNVSPIVFMLPTLLIFPAWTSILCVLCEACIHMLSHKRNKMKKYKTNYQSPLHLISSEFCGYCRSHRWKEKIKRIQEKRSMRRGLTGPSVG